MMDAGDHLLDLPPRPPVGVPVVCGAQTGVRVDGGSAGDPDDGVCRRKTVREANRKLCCEEVPALPERSTQKKTRGFDGAVLRRAALPKVLFQEYLLEAERRLQ